METQWVLILSGLNIAELSYDWHDFTVQNSASEMSDQAICFYTIPRAVTCHLQSDLQCFWREIHLAFLWMFQTLWKCIHPEYSNIGFHNISTKSQKTVSVIAFRLAYAAHVSLSGFRKLFSLSVFFLLRFCFPSTVWRQVDFYPSHPGLTGGYTLRWLATC